MATRGLARPDHARTARRWPLSRAAVPHSADQTIPIVIIALQTLIAAACAVYYATGVRSDLAMTFAGSSLLIMWIVNLIWLVKRRWVVTFLFVFFVIEPIVQTYITVYLGRGDLLWRYIFSYDLMIPTLRLAFVHAHVMLLAVTAALLFMPEDEATAPKPRLNWLGQGAAWFVLLAFGAYVLGVAFTQSRDEFMSENLSGDRLLMTVGPLALGMITALGAIGRGASMKAMAAVGAIICVLVAVSGYRSTLVMAGIALATAFLARRRVGWPTILLGVLVLVAAYYFMSYLSFLRANQVTFGDLLAGKAVSVTTEDVSKRTGSAEQIAMFTVYYGANLPTMWGMGYVQSLLRVLPQGIGYDIFKALRPQDLLVNGAPAQFQQTGINLGAYFFAEAMLNFGRFWSLALNILVIAALAQIERGRMRSEWRQMSYPVFAIMMPALALYGSTNFIKQSIMLLVALAVIYFMGTFDWGGFRRSGGTRRFDATRAAELRPRLRR